MQTYSIYLNNIMSRFGRISRPDSPEKYSFNTLRNTHRKYLKTFEEPKLYLSLPVNKKLHFILNTSVFLRRCIRRIV